MKKDNAANWVMHLTAIFALTSFIVAEIVAAIAFRKSTNLRTYSGLVNVYTICMIVALPVATGMGGYLSVRKQISSSSNDGLQLKLSRHFLFGIIAAYAAVIVLVEVFA